MCYFITLGVPGQHERAMQQRVPRGLALTSVENDSVLGSLPSGWRTWLLTSGGCSCNLFVSPSKAREVRGETSHSQPRQGDRSRARRVKQGWSQAKIARAEEQSRQNASGVKLPDWVGLRDDARQFISALVGKFGPVCLLAHWYDDELQRHNFELVATKTVSCEAFARGTCEIEVDELIRVEP